MANLAKKLEKFFLNRVAMIITLVGSLLLVLIAYNLASWIFLRQFEENVDNELGRRLQSVADVVSKLLESELPDDEIVATIPPNPIFIYRIILNDIRIENQLQAIYLVDPDYRTIVSIPEGNFEAGDIIAYLQEDSAQFAIALNGVAAFSRLHEIADSKFKSGYAPIRNLAGHVIAVVVIEASANFFAILDKFQNGLFLGIFLSFLVVLLYGVFIAWAVTYFVRLQEKAQRNEKLAAMGQMAATVAHEIRNPLGIIKSTAEVLQDLVQPHGKQKELIEFIPS
ncbi:MAG: histidine kinase dimerization/phospho-acceptor domain-containing protein, partial [bacterium]